MKSIIMSQKEIRERNTIKMRFLFGIWRPSPYNDNAMYIVGLGLISFDTLHTAAQFSQSCSLGHSSAVPLSELLSQDTHHRSDRTSETPLLSVYLMVRVLQVGILAGSMHNYLAIIF